MTSQSISKKLEVQAYLKLLFIENKMVWRSSHKRAGKAANFAIRIQIPTTLTPHTRTGCVSTAQLDTYKPESNSVENLKLNTWLCPFSNAYGAGLGFTEPALVVGRLKAVRGAAGEEAAAVRALAPAPYGKCNIGIAVIIKFSVSCKTLINFFTKSFHLLSFWLKIVNKLKSI